jgi:choline transporter-like protein 2/4/5
MVLQKDKDEAEQKKSEVDFKALEMNRSCTDTLCCILFLVFIASLVGVTGYSIKNGNPLAMITPFDSDGHQCGMTL